MFLVLIFLLALSTLWPIHQTYGQFPSHSHTTLPCACRDYWRPVCGTDGNTYSSPCHAGCAGVSIASYQRCYSPPAADDAGRRRTLRPCACPYNMDPVCGMDEKTYSNSCVANCAGVPVVSRGSCNARRRNQYNCLCPAIYMPVCGNYCQTYSNQCLADCAGVRVMGSGVCGRCTWGG